MIISDKIVNSLVINININLHLLVKKACRKGFKPPSVEMFSDILLQLSVICRFI